MSNLEQIKTFIMVVEENSFAAAARKRRISTAAISRQVTNLETSLGVQLLKRTTRRLMLTEMGQKYFEHCKNALAELATAEDAINNAQQEPTGILRITSNRYFAFKVILPRLGDFMAQYPKLKLDLEIAERFPNIEKEKIDILVGTTLEGDKNLVRRRIAMTQQIVCAAPRYLKKFGTPEKPGDLVKHQILAHSGLRSMTNTMTFKANRQVVVQPCAYINDAGALMSAAEQGLGIIKLRDYMLEEVLEKKRLVEILKKYREPAQPIYYYYQANRYLETKIRCFIDFYFPD
jgi:DNA-binding transcriptional LysR family regulator